MMNPEFLIMCNIALCVCVILLGSYQRRHFDRFSVAAIVLMCFNGMGAVLLYSKTEFFPAAAFGVAIILLVHGAMIHTPPALEFPEYECPAFRVRSVCNHETWVLVAATAGLVSAFGV
jgi:hypothetical protein